MKRGHLREYFSGIGVKRLTAVDAEPGRSNQHEVGTTREMRMQFLGEVQHQRFKAVYVWLGEVQDSIRVEDTATHYDARAQQTHRAAEWRLYYTANEVTEAMREGDALYLAKSSDDVLHFVVAPAGSTAERQLSWLFGLHPSGRSFVSRGVDQNEPELDFAARFILDDIGVEQTDHDSDRIDAIIDRFGLKFPGTSVFSSLARETLPEVTAETNPDDALLAWLSHEEALFLRLERRIVAKILDKGFQDASGSIDVDKFIRFSLSVQNRRKARMGLSLEHHLEAVFRIHRLAFDRGAITENNQRPDFLFPSANAYQEASGFGDPNLTMLGVKSTCKDRWRQVLAEASKIPTKHLLTLEPSISEPQTEQMENSQLQLVVPKPIHASYTDTQRSWLWNIEDFIRHVKARHHN